MTDLIGSVVIVCGVVVVKSISNISRAEGERVFGVRTETFKQVRLLLLSECERVFV